MIEVKNLNKTYDRTRGRDSRVLRDVTLTLPDKGFVCILGPSGCGKTSLLNAVGGLDKFDSGSVSLDDRVFTRCGQRAFELERDRNFGYIFQNYYLLQDHTVAYNVYLGLHSLGLSHREKLDRVKKALRAVGMELYLRRRVRELSGGQQQRVAIARALARRPRVIFADEPTGNLDEDNTRAVCSLLRAASRESLVVMVTHEERIARFFADRIIRLSDGAVTDDTQAWEREALSAGSDKVIYAGELEDRALEEGAVTLRVLREEGADPVHITVAVLRSRIVLKLEDPRTSSLGGQADLPVIREGHSPTVSLEELDKPSAAREALFDCRESDHVRPGRGVTLPMIAREARELSHGRGTRRLGLMVFLVLLTVLTLLSVGDYLSLATVDPEDFITNDSHILKLSFDQGQSLADDGSSLAARQQAFLGRLQSEAPDFEFMPFPSVRMYLSTSVYKQLQSARLYLPNAYSFAPIDALDPSTLLYGHMPEQSTDIVVDRQILEKMLNAGDNIVSNSISDISFFLDTRLSAESRRYYPTIVGICDSGEPTVYIGTALQLSLRNGNLNVMSLSDAKRLYPEAFGPDTSLAEDECIVNTAAAGDVYAHAVGTVYRLTFSSQTMHYRIKDVVSLPEGEPAYIIVNDGDIDFISLYASANSDVLLYCRDKAAMQAYLRTKELRTEDMIVALSDPYQQQYDAYADAARVKADARSIVTLTVIIVCLVMLFLLCRSQARERIELVAVYRLLGIPGGKLYAIFLTEALLSCLLAVIPAAALTWAAVAALHRWTSYAASILLPLRAAALTGLGIAAYYLLVSVLPLFSLLRLPPARLAAKYE